MSQERVESQGFFEMLWDCEYCDAKGLLAKSQRHCPECGGKQNADKRYFPKDGEAVRVDGHKFVGADRYCPNCNAPQSRAAHNCTNCGAPQDSAAEVKGVATPVAAQPKKKFPWLWVIVVVGVVVGVILLVRWCNRTEEKTVTVVAHRWERSIGIEEYGNDRREGWCDSMPRTAHEEGRRMKDRPDKAKRVQDGEECKDEKVDKKDGTFEVVRKCKPVYRTEKVDDAWCTYTVRAWKEVDRVKTGGAGMKPEWPAQGLPPEQYSEVLGARRRGAKKETYSLELGGLGAPQSCDVSEPVWRKHADGAAVKVEVRSRSGEVVCDSL